MSNTVTNPWYYVKRQLPSAGLMLLLNVLDLLFVALSYAIIRRPDVFSSGSLPLNSCIVLFSLNGFTILAVGGGIWYAFYKYARVEALLVDWMIALVVSVASLALSAVVFATQDGTFLKGSNGHDYTGIWICSMGVNAFKVVLWSGLSYRMYTIRAKSQEYCETRGYEQPKFGSWIHTHQLASIPLQNLE